MLTEVKLSSIVLIPTSVIRPFDEAGDGEGAPAGDGDGAPAGDGEGGDGAPTGDGDDGTSNKKTFTQEEVQKLIEKERKIQKQRTEQTIKDLERLKQSKTLTDKEKSTLEERIEGLKNELLTKEELAAKEKNKLQREHKKIVEDLSSKATFWENKFKTATINTAIVSASSAEKAFNPEQIIAILKPNTRLVQDIGEDGNPLDSFTPKVKIDTVDKDNKPIQLDLTIPEAIKHMKDSPSYANLFEDTAKSGLGLSGGNGNRTNFNVRTMSVEDYKAHREQILRSK